MDSAILRPSFPIVRLTSGDVSANRMMTLAMSWGDEGSNSHPFRPSLTKRGVSLTLLASTGIPQAIASQITLEVPSWNEGRQTASAS